MDAMFNIVVSVDWFIAFFIVFSFHTVEPNSLSVQDTAEKYKENMKIIVRNKKAGVKTAAGKGAGFYLTSRVSSGRLSLIERRTWNDS